MFTQCPKCETVFRLSADALRVAGGQVRCGRCGEVFDALTRLADNSTGFTKGESPLELETRADEILESVLDESAQAQESAATDVAGVPPGVEVARLQLIEPLEFTLPPHPEDAALAAGNAARTEPQHIEQPWRGLPLAAWLTAAVVLAVLLWVQIVRGNPGWRAAPDANLASYQLHQGGPTGDPAVKGTLRVRASITNTAAQLQRLPLLRVSLVNRFGSRVGTRDFEPSEYLGKASARMLAPGERADASLDILDPGQSAEGFEIDVCLRRIDQHVVCAGDAASPAR